MARGIVTCHGCKQRIQWFDDAWRGIVSGSAECPSAGGRHTIEVSK